MEAHDPLDPLHLAACLEVMVWTPRDVPKLPSEVINQLLHGDPWGWSAVSLMLAEGRGVVIYNPRNSKQRQASDIVHELAHFILDHKPGTIILSPNGSIAIRTFDEKQEEEANWLAGCLLLPREALLTARRERLTVPQIADRYGVSKRLVTYRLNISGVEAQLRATRRRSRS